VFDDKWRSMIERMLCARYNYKTLWLINKRCGKWLTLIDYMLQVQMRGTWVLRSESVLTNFDWLTCYMVQVHVKIEVTSTELKWYVTGVKRGCDIKSALGNILINDQKFYTNIRKLNSWEESKLQFYFKYWNLIHSDKKIVRFMYFHLFLVTN